MRAASIVFRRVGEIIDGDIPDSDIVPRLILITEACRQVDNREGLSRCRSALQPHRGEHGIFRFGQYWGVAEQSIGDAQLALGELDGMDRATHLDRTPRKV